MTEEIRNIPDLLHPELWEEGQVFFAPADAGDAQLAAGYHEGGSYEGWQRAMLRVAALPRVRFLLYSALAAPLIEIVRAPNFAVDTSYATSSGKTTALRVAASVWGLPDLAGSGVMHTWEATPVWVERAATVINSMPLILDDTKLARRPADVARTLYMFSSGSGRGRGSKEGLDATRHFRSVMISSGEAPLTSFTPDGGTRGRCISLWGAPFEGSGSARAVAELNLELGQHYGHAGSRYIEHILPREGRWDEIRSLYQDSLDKYRQWAGDSAVGGRIAAYCAVVDTAAILAHEALDLPWSYSDPVEPLWEGLIARASEADRAKVARGVVLAWASAHQSDFYGRHRTDGSENPVQPPAGWAGKWDGGDDWEYIAFYPSKIRAILMAEDYSSADAEAAARLWSERGWLKLEQGGDGKARHPKIRVSGSAARLVAITRAAADEE